MASIAHSYSATGFSGWLYRAEAWLDSKGRGAWFVAMIISFILVWPLGLALLAYMIWSKKMSCASNRVARSFGKNRHGGIHRTTGNAAFDAYKSETLQRLEEEQENFEAFLQRLRDARDKAEFDQFMDERAKSPATRDDADGDKAA